MVTKYKVYWDNGASACGTFPFVFQTRSAAQKWADGWMKEMRVLYDDDNATAEVVEFTVEDDEDEQEDWDEKTLRSWRP